MLRLLSEVWKRIVHGKPDEVLDHVPVNRKSSDKWRRKKLTEAAERHGKQFKCAGSGLNSEVIHRVTGPSDVLEKIERASRAKGEQAGSRVVRTLRKGQA